MVTQPAVIDELDARTAKVLRFVVSRSKTEPVTPSMCVVQIAWSDLPHTDMEARKALGQLLTLGLVERKEKNAYGPTEIGQEVLKSIDEKRLWRKPPLPSVTNIFRNREESK